jgi:hypothetical protein
MSLFGNSRYLTKEDVGNGSILTIQGFVQENVAKQNEPEELKYVMKFHETRKGVVMKVVLGAQLMGIFQLQEEGHILTHLIGQAVTLFHDRSVVMGNRIVGGIRFRLPQHGDVPYSESVQQPEPQGFRPDPRQTPPPGTYQQQPTQFNQQPPQRPVGPPAAPRSPVQPAYPQQPPLAPRPPAPPAYSVPRPPDDVPWPTEGRI